MKANDGGLYLLQDGTYADPKACKKSDDGVLRHENGVAVALRDDGEPMTLGKVTEHNVKAAEAAAAPAPGEPAAEDAADAAAEQPAPARAQDAKAE